MTTIAYSVIATLPDEASARAYIDWLRDGHTDAVLKGGADSAHIIRIQGEPIRVETRYTFPSREAFEAYERDHAPALREDGRARFADKGIAFERRVGEFL